MQEGEESFHELRQTQLNELEVIQSMYPTSDDFQRLTSEEHFRQIQENMTLNDGLSIRFLIQEIDHLTLEFEMPLRYPEESLHVHVSQPYLQKECCQELQRVANETAERSKGGEAVLDVIGVVVGKFQEMKAHQKEHDEDEAQAQAASVPTAAPVLGRRLLWFHHIKSPKKKRSIVEWARELGLQGMAKPGYPGILFVEGEESNCAEYVHRLKRLRWKSIEVRAEEAEDGDKGTSIEDMRTYRGGFQMLSEEDTSHMTSELERIGKSDFVRRGILRME